jgi:hypothetical protein
MIIGAIFAAAQQVQNETDQGANGNKEEKIPPHNVTSQMI